MQENNSGLDGADKEDGEEEVVDRGYLPARTILDEYVIERELAHGGFSSVYLAREIYSMAQVAIKEYIPRRLAYRDENNVVVPKDAKSKPLFLKGRSLFFEEAKVLAKLKHPNIVDVVNFFQENSTVYMVMAYESGVTLEKMIIDRTEFTDKQITAIFRKVMDGLEVVHNNHLVHLDIKPSNIMLRPDNNPLLIDFGANQTYSTSKKYQAQRVSSKIGKVYTRCFSPYEQCVQDGHIGPWSDIYALGASMRTCIEKKAPPHSVDRKKKETLIPMTKMYKRKYPAYLLRAIDWAMEIEPENRPQNIREFKDALKSDIT